MAEASPQNKLTERFLNGETTRQENAAMVQSLLLDSAAVNGAVDSGWHHAPATDENALAVAFDRALAGADDEAARLDAKRHSAAELAEKIDRRLTGESLTEVETDLVKNEVFATWTVSEALCLRSFETGLEDPERAVALARLAVRAAELTPVSNPRLGHDVTAAAWAQLGNAQRIASQLATAEEAFETAQRHLAEGMGDPLAQAKLLSFQASLDHDRARYRQGIANCRKAARLYGRVGDRHGQGRMLIQEAGIHVDADDLSTAILCLDRAAARVDPVSEPRLALVALQSLIGYLDQQGHFDEAWLRVEEARELAKSLGLDHRLDLLRLRWIEGRVAAHRGDDGHAENCWNEARAAFIELSVAYDAALVALELTELLARQGRCVELRQLVDEMLPVFSSRSLHREVQTALKLFSDAVRDEATEIAHLARRVGHYLEKTQNRPQVPFQA